MACFFGFTNGQHSLSSCERHESGSQLPGGLDYNQPSPSALGDSEIAKALQMPDQLTRVLYIEGQV